MIKAKPAQFQLRLPQSLKAALERRAASDGTSLNQFLVVAAAEKLSSLEAVEAMIAERQARGDKEKALATLSRQGGEEPAEWDRLPS